jgi:glycyl-tRNA synthetase beta chain
LDLRLTLADLVSGPQDDAFWSFMSDRIRFVLEQRGYDPRNVRAVTHGDPSVVSPLVAKRKLETLPEFTESEDFKQLAGLFKRVRNIAKNLNGGAPDLGGTLTEPSELALTAEVDKLTPAIEAAVRSGTGYRQAFAEAAKAGPAVAKFFDDVMVMAEDLKLRDARLRLLRRLEGLILQLADVSEIVPEEK